MKSQIVILVLFTIVISIYGKLTDKCWSNSDCGIRECCAGKAWKKAGSCTSQPQRGHKCYPWIHPSSKLHCPCVLGTTCTQYYDKYFAKNKFKCMKFIPEEIEISVPQI